MANHDSYYNDLNRDRHVFAKHKTWEIRVHRIHLTLHYIQAYGQDLL